MTTPTPAALRALRLARSAHATADLAARGGWTRLTWTTLDRVGALVHTSCHADESSVRCALRAELLD